MNFGVGRVEDEYLNRVFPVISFTHVVRAECMVKGIEVFEDALEISIEWDELSFLVDLEDRAVVARDKLEGDVSLWQEPLAVSLVDSRLFQYQRC